MKKYNNFILEKTEIFRKISSYYADILDVKIISLFDSGLNGAAYLTSKNTVIKITPSYNEANTIYKLMNKQKNKFNKHIADYYDIKQISLDNEIYYAIHLELLKLDCEIYKLYKEFMNILTEHNKIFNNYLSHYKSKHVKELYHEVSSRINPKLRKFILQLIELIEELENLNIENEDLHAGNLGYKNGNLAIFDILISTEINYLPYNKCEKIYESIHFPGGYDQGDCNFYAIALHKLTGYPIYSVRGYYKEDDWDEVIENGDIPNYYHEDGHVVVLSKNGLYIDADGEYTEEELIKQTHFGSYIERVDLVKLTEKEAYNLYYGSDEQEDIKDEDKYKVDNILLQIKQK